MLRVIVLVAIVVIGAALLLRRAPEPHAPDELPTFSLMTLDGDTEVSSSSLQGKPLVINFWASWCEPCRREAPLLDRIQSEFRDRGLVVLGVGVQDVRLSAQDFVDEYNLDYLIVEDLDQELFGELKETDGLPQTYFVTATGQVVSEGVAAPVLGELDETALREAVTFLLEGDG